MKILNKRTFLRNIVPRLNLQDFQAYAYDISRLLHANGSPFRSSSSPPNPLTTPLAGVSHVWPDSSRLLRFCHESERLTLTVQRASDRNRQAGILLLRKHLKDDPFLREVSPALAAAAV